MQPFDYLVCMLSQISCWPGRFQWSPCWKTLMSTVWRFRRAFEDPGQGFTELQLAALASYRIFRHVRISACASASVCVCTWMACSTRESCVTSLCGGLLGTQLQHLRARLNLALLGLSFSILKCLTAGRAEFRLHS